jgi:hypothetical protein
MLEDLYESLELMKLTPQNVYDQIIKLKNDKVDEVVHVLNTIIISENEDLSTPSSLYNFVASENLSGGSQYCASINCRLDKASEMANFACLYADTVLIINPFDKYLEFQLYNETLRESIANDILVIWYLSPLIRRGIVRFAQTEHHFCSNCFEKLSSNYEIKKESAYNYLHKEYLENVTIFFENNEKFGKIEILGPEELVEHGAMYINFTHYLPKELSKYANSKGKHKLDKEILERSRLLYFLPDIVIKDFAIQDWYTKNFDFSYLTNREVDVKLINQTNDYDINERNSKVFESLAHQLPVIRDVNIKNLIKIREKDGESFELYRHNMKKLVRELPDNPSHIKEAFSDIVQTEIDKINISLSESRKSIIKSITKNVIITAGIVSIGLTTGILPDNIKEIVAVAGGCGLAQTAINNVTDNFTKPNTLRENPYYFLWKVNKKVRK